ncbi:transcriptional regulator [Clostridium thermosuccinogenes]|jgi:BlaI family penicillinase repressor|uniref:Transcriptional regulator n=1 Tax=Clostridium thermosuccinogenes TaxID=84032 RepID=A0A2K2F7A8_9CLOT|nr:BlaI/MecI/CopY family transcriptional regulator [Pseudoclostridium thermosuccinogenes]AUS96771.1 transcriptional regulator [Pseudoclostridium thermosuccinogenes]PNT92567.1 transcriptional regulator [Pseudoclostridium thermosuccinogenes]PNT94667.1 transcriptional regulator [Pseudoclostridium thermosuccinogenes]PNU00588.1 transcriptional regulator [Pseudoclostridium thermosuccinogenes]
MKKLPNISDAEWQVMRVLWEKSPLTSTEIIDALRDSTTWSPKTIHTLISRLVKKEVVGVNKDFSLNKYFPLVTEEECRKVETRSFIQKVYDGSLHLLIKSFIENEKLTSEEIDDLRRMLDEKSKQGGR